MFYCPVVPPSLPATRRSYGRQVTQNGPLKSTLVLCAARCSILVTVSFAIES